MVARDAALRQHPQLVVDGRGRDDQRRVDLLQRRAVLFQQQFAKPLQLIGHEVNLAPIVYPVPLDRLAPIVHSVPLDRLAPRPQPDHVT